MKIYNAITHTTALTLLLAANVSMAEIGDDDQGLYVGASYGYLKAKDSGEFNDSNDAYRILIGGQFNKVVAIETAYIDFDEYGKSTVNAETDGYTLALKLSLPITDYVGLYLRGGQLWWDTDYQFLGFNGQTDGEELFYGLGAEFGLSDNVDLRLEYNRYNVEFESDEVGALAQDDSLDTDLDFANITLQYTF